MAEKKFGGRTFRVVPMLATGAIVLQARVMAAAGPALSSLGDVFAGMDKDASEDVRSAANAAAIGAFARIFASAKPDELAGLIRDIVETAQIRRDSGDYHPVDFDGDFTDHPGDVYPVLVWVLREQFGPFFFGLLGNGGLAKAVKG